MDDLIYKFTLLTLPPYAQIHPFELFSPTLTFVFISEDVQ